MHIKNRKFSGGFTLIELLVTIAIISLLLSLMVPALSLARRQTQSVLCASRLRGLVTGNVTYASEYDGYFVLAAEDMLDRGGNRKRWHGVRVSPGGTSSDPDENRFDPYAGPLCDYIAGGAIKQCPNFSPAVEGFEAAAGGYGYNQQYIGGRYDDASLSRSLRAPATVAKASNRSARMADVQHAGSTVMFTDTAIATGKNQLAEYSFCEPPYSVGASAVASSDGAQRQAPTIHFRHQGKANVGWVDGHVSGEQMSFSAPYGVYGVSEADARRMNLGWFGPDSNELFDRD